MPKKFAGENSKATAALERRAQAKQQQLMKKQQDLEDEKWRDDDKHVLKKQQRKEQVERKKQEAQAKKSEVKALLEMETKVAVASVAGKQPAAKLTRAMIVAETERRQTVAQPRKKEPETHLEAPLVENLNRLKVDEEANTVDEALIMLSGKETAPDKHPEKRMRAAYTSFEERNLPRLKLENPSLRMSQLKQMLFKEWSKSPENPTNAKTA